MSDLKLGLLVISENKELETKPRGDSCPFKELCGELVVLGYQG